MDELEELVLDQFVEVFDRIILNEKKHNDFVKKNNEEQTLQIQQLISKDEENSRQIELLKQQVEELLKINAPESCHQLSKQGEGIDGKRELVDPDGKNIGFKPIEVSTLKYLRKFRKSRMQICYGFLNSSQKGTKYIFF